MRVFVALVASVLIAAPALASSEESKKPEEKKICRNVEETGTRLGKKKVCKTAAEWAAQAESTEQDLRNARRLTR